MFDFFMIFLSSTLSLTYCLKESSLGPSCRAISTTIYSASDVMSYSGDINIIIPNGTTVVHTIKIKSCDNRNKLTIIGEEKCKIILETNQKMIRGTVSIENLIVEYPLKSPYNFEELNIIDTFPSDEKHKAQLICKTLFMNYQSLSSFAAVASDILEITIQSILFNCTDVSLTAYNTLSLNNKAASTCNINTHSNCIEYQLDSFVFVVNIIPHNFTCNCFMSLPCAVTIVDGNDHETYDLQINLLKKTTLHLYETLNKVEILARGYESVSDVYIYYQDSDYSFLLTEKSKFLMQNERVRFGYFSYCSEILILSNKNELHITAGLFELTNNLKFSGSIYLNTEVASIKDKSVYLPNLYLNATNIKVDGPMSISCNYVGEIISITKILHSYDDPQLVIESTKPIFLGIYLSDEFNNSVQELFYSLVKPIQLLKTSSSDVTTNYFGERIEPKPIRTNSNGYIIVSLKFNFLPFENTTMVCLSDHDFKLCPDYCDYFFSSRNYFSEIKNITSDKIIFIANDAFKFIMADIDATKIAFTSTVSNTFTIDGYCYRKMATKFISFHNINVNGIGFWNCPFEIVSFDEDVVMGEGWQSVNFNYETTIKLPLRIYKETYTKVASRFDLICNSISVQSGDKWNITDSSGRKIQIPKKIIMALSPSFDSQIIFFGRLEERTYSVIHININGLVSIDMSRLQINCEKPAIVINGRGNVLLTTNKNYQNIPIGFGSDGEYSINITSTSPHALNDISLNNSCLSLESTAQITIENLFASGSSIISCQTRKNDLKIKNIAIRGFLSARNVVAGAALIPINSSISFSNSKYEGHNITLLSDEHNAGFAMFSDMSSVPKFISIVTDVKQKFTPNDNETIPILLAVFDDFKLPRLISNFYNSNNQHIQQIPYYNRTMLFLNYSVSDSSGTDRNNFSLIIGLVISGCLIILFAITVPIIVIKCRKRKLSIFLSDDLFISNQGIILD